MPGGHQIPAAVFTGPHQVTGGFTGPHQVTGGFLAGAGDRHRGDLTQMKEAGQMRGIPGVGFDPVAGGADQLRRRGHLTGDPRRSQCSGQPEPGRAGLIGHRHWAR